MDQPLKMEARCSTCIHPPLPMGIISLVLRQCSTLLASKTPRTWKLSRKLVCWQNTLSYSFIGWQFVLGVASVWWEGNPCKWVSKSSWILQSKSANSHVPSIVCIVSVQSPLACYSISITYECVCSIGPGKDREGRSREKWNDRLAVQHNWC